MFMASAKVAIKSVKSTRSSTVLGVTLYKQFNNIHYEKAAALSTIIFLLSSLSASVYIYTNMKKQGWENE